VVEVADPSFTGLYAASVTGRRWLCDVSAGPIFPISPFRKYLTGFELGATSLLI